MDADMETEMEVGECSGGPAATACSKRLGIKNTIQTSFGDDYVFQIASSQEIPALAVSLSTNTIKLYSPATRQYLAEENVASIGCPETGCEVRMEMEMCQRIIRPEVFERWGMVMCELMVEERFYCPYNDCSAIMMVDDDGGEVIRASECPYCNRLFCAQCRVAWHGDIECSEFQALGDGERERGPAVEECG